MRGKREAVLLRFDPQGTRWASALVYEGLFAIHKTPGPSKEDPGRAWSVTHVPSGCCLLSAPDRARAKEIVVWLTELGVPWQFEDREQASPQIKIYAHELVKAGIGKWPKGIGGTNADVGIDLLHDALGQPDAAAAG